MLWGIVRRLEHEKLTYLLASGLHQGLEPLDVHGVLGWTVPVHLVVAEPCEVCFRAESHADLGDGHGVVVGLGGVVAAVLG